MQVDELKTVERGDGLKNGEAEPSKVFFMPEQQAKVQELIDEAYRKAYAKAQKTRSSSEEVERLKSEMERLKSDKKMAHLLRSISKHSVVDAEEVADLVKDRVKMDEDGGFSVTGESGALKVNSSGNPMSIEEYIGHWLSERPHHLRASGSHGAGSFGSRFGEGAMRHNLGDPAAWRNMPREELDRLLREGINVQGSAGQTYKFKDVKNPFIEARRRKFQSSASIGQ
ncbi:MAG: hypothetical protein Q7T24_01715 [Deltaproteobacteria bacterium]|nr:hypothetical protein [Deltaproteobacteria bacterium]